MDTETHNNDGRAPGTEPDPASEDEREHAGAGESERESRHALEQADECGLEHEHEHQLELGHEHEHEHEHEHGQAPHLRTTSHDHANVQMPAAPNPLMTPRRARFAIVCSLVIVAAVAICAIVLYARSLPITVTLNGDEMEIGLPKTVEHVVDAAADMSPQPGNLVAVDGSVIEEGAGETFHVTINGVEMDGSTHRVANGDVVEITDGEDVVEDYDVTVETVPYGVNIEGNGAIHILEGTGVDGEKEVLTGRVSGISVETVTREPVNLTCRKVSPQVGDDKVVALTFDDGPWDEWTEQILDLLAKYDAKATFFTVGSRISGDGIDLVKREIAEGHQVCTHTWDHAAGSGQGVNLGYMSAEEQIDEVQKGYDAIETATGEPAPTVIRTPGGNFGTDVMINIGPLISAEIGWNIDTEDWSRPGTTAIVEQIESAWPGCIILMHDGGGDRSQTVKALKKALPYLVKQGYTFVTIDELMAYDLA